MKKHPLVFLVIVGSLASCGNKYDKVMPADFNFIYSSGYFADSMNTFDSLFTGYGKATIVFTKAEKQRIYKVMADNDYLSLAENFTENHMAPVKEYVLFVKASGREKTIRYLDGMGNDERTKQGLERLMVINDTIWGILRTKEEFKKLPPDHRIAL